MRRGCARALLGCVLAGCSGSPDHPGANSDASGGPDGADDRTATEAGDDGGFGDASPPANRTDGAPSDAMVSDADVSEAAAVSDSAPPGWALTWSDEFNGADGSAADPGKWTYDVGGTGWGNQELEYYTRGTANAAVQGGNLVITATTAGTSQLQCSYGACRYTSARLLTKGLFTQQYGRIEARIQIPAGVGLWPAFWMLGSNIDTVSWPACGEIDIMENIGKEPSINHGSLHAPGANLSGQYTAPNGARLSDAFHVYAVEWDASAIRFFVDGQLYETQVPTNTPTGGRWVFDHPFFLILNVAVGGTFPGNPDATTTFPQTMKVDYVRVYQKNGTEP